MISFKRHRFPKDIIITAVHRYLRYKLSFSDVSELLLERGINVSREAIREWVQKFGPQIGNILDRKRRKTGKRWYVDETYCKRSDSHRGYDQVKEIVPKTRHHKVKCLNNKAKSSHVPQKRGYKPMRGSKNFETMDFFLVSFESMCRFFRKIRPINFEMRKFYKEKLAEFSVLLQVNCVYNKTRKSEGKSFEKLSIFSIDVIDPSIIFD